MSGMNSSQLVHASTLYSTTQPYWPIGRVTMVGSIQVLQPVRQRPRQEPDDRAERQHVPDAGRQHEAMMPQRPGWLGRRV